MGMRLRSGLGAIYTCTVGVDTDIALYIELGYIPWSLVVELPFVDVVLQQFLCVVLTLQLRYVALKHFVPLPTRSELLPASLLPTVQRTVLLCPEALYIVRLISCVDYRGSRLCRARTWVS